MTRTAVLAGATGAVGSEVLKALLEDPEWERVHSLVRRPSGNDDPKLIEHVVDFDDLDQHVSLFADADVFAASVVGPRLAPVAGRRSARSTTATWPSSPSLRRPVRRGSS